MRRYVVLLSLVLVSSTTAWGYNISDVTVSPLNPTTATPVKVKVTGNAPATNYRFDHAKLWQLGAMYFLDMYWTSGTGIGGMALVPYTHEESLGLLAEGKYTVYVRSFCDNLVRESKSVSFTVTKAIVFNWPTLPNLFGNPSPFGNPSLFGNLWTWPGLFGSQQGTSTVQVQTFVMGPGEISVDFSLTSSITP